RLISMRIAATLLSLLLSISASAQRLAVIVDGGERPEYNARGTTYVEALRGRNYSLRLSNPTPYRVAVALSVDGLNTIDARHSDAWSASKWILDPYETIDIDGWQVSDSTARRFFFTGERNSYGAKLGQTENLGVIEAVFYRERQRPVSRVGPLYEGEERSAAAGAMPAPKAADDYAATGMGHRTDHSVYTVDIDLESHPIASERIRYEFRAQLVKLGVIDVEPRPLDRREKARGFERFCPERN
ncbi:MAG TPA: hypothetical protein VMU84_21280, partial [Thermoanaerobaculia bacterium]|nr:hypothetical protein [Thermoanaerobaculia bacterium]